MIANMDLQHMVSDPKLCLTFSELIVWFLGNTMRLSLLRSAKAPDAHADMGRHQFRYALFGHGGPLNADVVRASYNFNHPIKPLFSNGKSLSFNIVEYEGSGNVIVNAIKRAEDDADVLNGSAVIEGRRKNVIVRAYESLGGKGNGKFFIRLPVKKVIRCNLLEEDIEDVPTEKLGNSTSFSINLKSFEVATFRIEVE
jgi:alpha-mannosidase